MNRRIVGLVHKLVNVSLIQEISGIHVIADNIPGRCHPGTAVKSRPRSGGPVVGSILCRFPGGNTASGHQVSGHLALLRHSRIPVKPCLQSRKLPLGVFRVKLSQSLLVALRKALLRHISLEIAVRHNILGSQLDIVAGYVSCRLGSPASCKPDFVPKYAVRSRILSYHSHSRSVSQSGNGCISRSRPASHIQAGSNNCSLLFRIGKGSQGKRRIQNADTGSKSQYAAQKKCHSFFVS